MAAGRDRRQRVCAVKRRRFPVGENPTRQVLQPEATGATVEVTKRLKPSGKCMSRIGDSASVQAATRVNAEQASKRSMCRPTRPPNRGRLPRLGKRAMSASSRSAGILAMACQHRKIDATREALCRGWDERPTRHPRGIGWATQGGGEARSTGEAG